MSDAHSPAAGWYDDPEMALRLRWWDGVRWTTHTRPKPVVEHPAEQAITGRSAASVGSAPDAVGGGSTVIAEPSAAEPYAYSAPYSWSPGSVGVTPVSPAIPSAPGSAAEPSAQPLGTYGLRARTPDEIWNTRSTSIDYTPERTTTPAAWALAFTPLVTVAAQTAAVVLSGFESTPWIWIVGAAVIPVLWIIIWVRRDRITLHEWGHLRRAHWGWAFLGALGYLVARTVVVRQQASGRGWWPLVVNLALIALLVNVGIFTPALGVIRLDLLP